MGFRRAASMTVAAAFLTLSACVSTISVDAGDDAWQASCVNVTATDCEGIVRMFLNNLAWNGGWVRDESGGTVQVSLSPTCPEFSDLAQPGACWKVNAPTRSSRACMIMARRIKPEQGFDFVWIGGDQLSGSFAAPKPGTTPC